MNDRKIRGAFGAVALLFLGALGTLALVTTPAPAQVSLGKATVAAPVYATGTNQPLSLDTGGNLRVIAAAGGGTMAVNIAQTCGAILPADDAAAAGCPLPMGGVYNTTLPTYTNLDRTQLQAASDGTLRTVPTLGTSIGLDALSNSSLGGVSAIGFASTGSFRPLPVSASYFNGTTWDRTRGDLNGAWTQGNVANDAVDAGNPIKVGGVFTTLPTVYTSGDRADLAVNINGVAMVAASGTLSADVAGTTMVGFSDRTGTVRPFGVMNYVYTGTSMAREFTCPSSAVVNVAAGATTELIAASGATTIRVCSMVLTGNTAATTATIVYGTGANCVTGLTALTGAMRIQDGGNISVSASNGSLFRGAASNALCLTAVTGTVTGFMTYAQY